MLSSRFGVRRAGRHGFGIGHPRHSLPGRTMRASWHAGIMGVSLNSRYISAADVADIVDVAKIVVAREALLVAVFSASTFSPSFS
jgi:hypothetical protein